MATLRQWFADFTESTGETPTHIVFSTDGLYGEWAVADRELVDFTTVSVDVLDREFDNGFGGQECPSLCAWSESWVVFKSTYDGAEALQWVPRHPVAHEPTIGGYI